MELSVQHNHPLATYTTLKVGGAATQFIDVHTEQELDTAVGYAQAHSLPITILGGGSNVLIADAGVAGLVLRMACMGVAEEVHESDILLTAQAGEVLDNVVAYAVDRGYWGLENLSHIPGTVGATPVQNVGAYGVEVKDVIESVRVYNTLERQFEMLTNAECCFGYRDSLFKKAAGRHYVVVAVTYRLHTTPTPQVTYKDLAQFFATVTPSLAVIRAAVIAIRSKKFPNWHEVGTAGSFFKNPTIPRAQYEALCTRYPELPGFDAGGDLVKVPLGWILDKVLNLKGTGTDTVGTYQGQALVLINKGGATAADFTTFAERITQQVHEATGIVVEWEVTKI